MIRKSIQWWAKHPWLVGWLAIIGIGWILGSTFPGPQSESRGLGLILIGLVVVWITSAALGVQHSWRRSAFRALGGLAAIFLVPACLTIPLLAPGLQSARVGKVHDDMVSINSAIQMYRVSTGRLPAQLNDLTVLTVVTDAKGERPRAFMGAVPQPPTGWAAYGYQARADGTFTLSSSGDGRTVSVAGIDGKLIRQ